MNKRRLLVLSSIAPNYAHFRAAQTVLAHLLEELARLGSEVSFAVAAERPAVDSASAERLRQAGVRAVAGAPPLLDHMSLPRTAAGRAALYAREAIDPRINADRPRFRHPEAEVARLQASGADEAILFWDTYYEHLVPALRHTGLRIYGYLARPPFAAGQALARERLSGVKRVLEEARLSGIERRHLARLRGLSGARNICAIDAAWYDRRAVGCSYLPNTWPDSFGDDWQARRRAAEGRRQGCHLLGNIGGLNATGNRFGLLYLADRILPLLGRGLQGLDWTVNICGRFRTAA